MKRADRRRIDLGTRFPLPRSWTVLVGTTLAKDGPDNGQKFSGRRNGRSLGIFLKLHLVVVPPQSLALSKPALHMGDFNHRESQPGRSSFSDVSMPGVSSRGVR